MNIRNVLTTAVDSHAKPYVDIDVLFHIHNGSGNELDASNYTLKNGKI